MLEKMENLPKSEQASNLEDLASKSWNLELIISGAAIFLVSYLPGLVDRGLWFYLDNLAADADLGKSALPILAYSFFKVIAWLLTGTFIVHFILRAFWVGLVGLHAVYPEGIQYEKLPMQTDFSREIGQRNFGQFSDYIHRLDRLSNQIFSVAFLIALMGLGISAIYLAIFLFTQPNVLQNWLGGSKVRTTIFFGLFLLLAFLPAVLQLWLRQPGVLDRPGVRKFAAWVFQYAPALMLPVVYRPLSYINLVYSSNVPRRRLYTLLVLGTILIMSTVIWVTLQTNMDLRGRSFMLPQDFAVRNNSIYKLYPAQYDNLRPADANLPAVSLASDVVEGPVLRIFVTYRKWLDPRISRQCQPAAVPENRSKQEQRMAQDSTNRQCLAHFFQLSVNDSLYSQPDWIFHTRPETGTPGLLGYVPTAAFRTGENVLTIRIPSSEKPDSLEVYGQVPFWFYGGGE